MGIGTLLSLLGPRQDKPFSVRQAADKHGQTALYTYLERTLKSPRFRRMLQEAAIEHAPEAEFAWRA